MGSRRKTGVEGVRLPELSRRAVIAGTSVAALGPANPAAAPASLPAASAVSDEATRHCRRWLAVNARIERLQDRWARLEGWLVREHGWMQLGPAEQQALPWAKELRDIDGCLDVLFEQRDGLLAPMPVFDAVSLDSVITRLAVVERLIWPIDHPEAHALIAGARQDLIALSVRAGVA
ncbi:MAG: helicase [Phenylobacterium sp.]|jgi:hypothetical protein|nr:helicase [Phenylobacterium sp.]